MTDPALQALLDKQAIAELLTRYLRSVDRGDVATLRACYLPGATEDHGGLFAGPAQDYVDSVAAALTHPRARTSHNMTNLLIDLDGDVATAESYCVTFARIKADGQYYHSFTGARMIDRLERRDGVWGISHRQLVWDWNHDAMGGVTTLNKWSCDGSDPWCAHPLGRAAQAQARADAQAGQA
jgi:SnoaL-like protein